MLWHGDERLPPSAPSRTPVVPGSDALRQAALEASWRRDRKVAQRRIAWRWLVWCLQRYSLPALGALGAVALVAYLAGVWPRGPAETKVTTPDLMATDPSLSAPVPVPSPTAGTTAEVEQAPLRLRGSARLNDAPPAAVPENADPVSADTLTLKPETWLHSKEP